MEKLKNTIKDKIKQTKFPLWILCVTFVWLAFGLIYLLAHLKETWPNPNELGDFLAGFFSPLAFLWLVLGYFLQQRELIQNTEALNLQRKEMEYQKIEFKRQADALDAVYTRATKKALPDIQFEKITTQQEETRGFGDIAKGVPGKPTGNMIYNCIYHNHGQRVNNVNLISFDCLVSGTFFKAGKITKTLEKESKGKLSFVINNTENSLPKEYLLTYRTEHGDYYCQEYRISNDRLAAYKPPEFDY